MRKGWCGLSSPVEYGGWTEDGQRGDPMSAEELGVTGVALVRDIQAWSGLVRLKEPIEVLKQELRTYRDELGNELLDLPEMDLPEDLSDLPAPARFVPEYDNLILSHADRTRVISDEYRKRVFLSAGRVRAIILVDGIVRGAWKIENARGGRRS